MRYLEYESHTDLRLVSFSFFFSQFQFNPIKLHPSRVKDEKDVYQAWYIVHVCNILSPKEERCIIMCKQGEDYDGGGEYYERRRKQTRTLMQSGFVLFYAA